jgi:hypothetical protein
MAAKEAVYTIVTGGTDVELIKVVSAYIRKGWRPIGGAIPAMNQQTQVLIQTLVRSGPEKNSSRRIKG